MNVIAARPAGLLNLTRVSPRRHNLGIADDRQPEFSATNDGRCLASDPRVRPEIYTEASTNFSAKRE